MISPKLSFESQLELGQVGFLSIQNFHCLVTVSFRILLYFFRAQWRSEIISSRRVADQCRIISNDKNVVTELLELPHFFHQNSMS